MVEEIGLSRHPFLRLRFSNTRSTWALAAFAAFVLSQILPSWSHWSAYAHSWSWAGDADAGLVRALLESALRFGVALAFVAAPRNRAMRMLNLAAVVAIAGLPLLLHADAGSPAIRPLGDMWRLPGDGGVAGFWSMGLEALVLFLVALRRNAGETPVAAGRPRFAFRLADAVPPAVVVLPIAFMLAGSSPATRSIGVTLCVLALSGAYGFAGAHLPLAASLAPGVALACLRLSNTFGDLAAFGAKSETFADLTMFAGIAVAAPLAAFALRLWRLYDRPWQRVRVCAAAIVVAALASAAPVLAA